MIPSKRIGRFFLTALAIYVLLTIPWPGVSHVYGAVFRAVGNVAFGSLGSAGSAKFTPEKLDPSGATSEMAVRTEDGPGSWTTRAIPVNTRRMGYIPTAEMIALMLATPIPWSRRWKKLLWGTLLVQLVVAVQVAVAIAYTLTQQADPAFPISPQGSLIFLRMYEIVVLVPTVCYIAPVLIWLSLTFRQVKQGNP
jgi:hypothetical protein